MGRIIDAVLAAGGVFGAQYTGHRLGLVEDDSARQWYSRLNKSAVTPPGPVFAVVWTVLDGLLAWSGYRLLRAKRSGRRTFALCLWSLCVAGVAGFPLVFFRERRLDISLELCLGLIVASAGSALVARKVDEKAARAQLPFFLWLLFALFLQEEVWRRN